MEMCVLCELYSVRCSIITLYHKMCRVFHGKHLSDSDSEFTSSTWCVRDGKMNCVQYCCVQSLPALFGSLVSRVVTSLQRTPRHSCFVDKSWCSISCWHRRCMGEHMCVSCCCSRISSVWLHHVLSIVSSYGDTTNGSTTHLSSQVWCVNVKMYVCILVNTWVMLRCEQ